MLVSEQWGCWSAACSFERLHTFKAEREVLGKEGHCWRMDPGLTDSASQELGSCPSLLSFLIFKMRIISAQSLPRDVGKRGKGYVHDDDALHTGKACTVTVAACVTACMVIPL